MKRFFSSLTISLAALLVTGAVSAQSEQTPEVILDEPIKVEEEAPEATEEDIDSREVDYSEENFRRSMELRDRELQRARGLSDSSVSTTSGLQALEGLPESSQKHLREQLREIIVEEGPWKPEDAGETYPYVPSEAAEKDGSLKLREENAWGELVAKYHEREAEIHLNSRRTAAATGNPAGADVPPESMGEDMGVDPGEDRDEDGDAGNVESAAESAERRAERQAALESLLNSGTPSAESGTAQAQSAATEGVSQNALQLLQQRQQVPEGAQAGSESASTEQEQSRQMAQGSQSAESSSASGSDAAATELDRSVELDLESEGVIAIRELEKIDLEEARDDENP